MTTSKTFILANLFSIFFSTFLISTQNNNLSLAKKICGLESFKWQINKRYSTNFFIERNRFPNFIIQVFEDGTIFFGCEEEWPEGELPSNCILTPTFDLVLGNNILFADGHLLTNDNKLFLFPSCKNHQEAVFLNDSVWLNCSACFKIDELVVNFAQNYSLTKESFTQDSEIKIFESNLNSPCWVCPSDEIEEVQPGKLNHFIEKRRAIEAFLESFRKKIIKESLPEKITAPKSEQKPQAKPKEDPLSFFKEASKPKPQPKPQPKPKPKAQNNNPQNPSRKSNTDAKKKAEEKKDVLPKTKTQKPTSEKQPTLSKALPCGGKKLSSDLDECLEQFGWTEQQNVVPLLTSFDVIDKDLNKVLSSLNNNFFEIVKAFVYSDFKNDNKAQSLDDKCRKLIEQWRKEKDISELTLLRRAMFLISYCLTSTRACFSEKNDLNSLINYCQNFCTTRESELKLTKARKEYLLNLNKTPEQDCDDQKYCVFPFLSAISKPYRTSGSDGATDYLVLTTPKNPLKEEYLNSLVKDEQNKTLFSHKVANFIAETVLYFGPVANPAIDLRGMICFFVEDETIFGEDSYRIVAEKSFKNCYFLLNEKKLLDEEFYQELLGLLEGNSELTEAAFTLYLSLIVTFEIICQIKKLTQKTYIDLKSYAKNLILKTIEVVTNKPHTVRPEENNQLKYVKFETPQKAWFPCGKIKSSEKTPFDQINQDLKIVLERFDKYPSSNLFLKGHTKSKYKDHLLATSLTYLCKNVMEGIENEASYSTFQIFRMAMFLASYCRIFEKNYSFSNNDLSELKNYLKRIFVEYNPETYLFHPLVSGVYSTNDACCYEKDGEPFQYSPSESSMNFKTENLEIEKSSLVSFLAEIMLFLGPVDDPSTVTPFFADNEVLFEQEDGSQAFYRFKEHNFCKLLLINKKAFLEHPLREILGDKVKPEYLDEIVSLYFGIIANFYVTCRMILSTKKTWESLCIYAEKLILKIVDILPNKFKTYVQEESVVQPYTILDALQKLRVL